MKNNYTKMEQEVLHMIAEGKKLHGLAREIAINLMIDNRMPKDTK